MLTTDYFFIAVFSIFALDIVLPRAAQLRAWYLDRYYEDESEGDVDSRDLGG